MTQVISNSGNNDISSDNEFWTHAKFKDELFIHLSRIKDSNKSNSVKEIQRIYLNDHKYYARARSLIYWNPITKPHELIPPFVVDTKDLESNPKLYSEFKEYISLSTEKEISFLLKEIAVKFFEAIDYSYTHLSVIPHIAVGIA
jgi:hypothetical protein